MHKLGSIEYIISFIPKIVPKELILKEGGLMKLKLKDSRPSPLQKIMFYHLYK